MPLAERLFLKFYSNIVKFASLPAFQTWPRTLSSNDQLRELDRSRVPKEDEA